MNYRNQHWRSRHEESENLKFSTDFTSAKFSTIDNTHAQGKIPQTVKVSKKSKQKVTLNELMIRLSKNKQRRKTGASIDQIIKRRAQKIQHRDYVSNHFNKMQNTENSSSQSL